jgi:uncharacterized DUF497 family protein
MQGFEWDAEKAASNLKKHGVSFEEAESVFMDSFGLEELDEEHSQEEVRWVLIGLSSSLRVLVTVYTERGSKIRLISSRKADAKERKAYQAYRQSSGG